ncbi:hypothetical protein GGF45_004866, partial [Coemansia sp. RSA 551]
KLAERFMQAIGKIQNVKDVPALESKATATSDLFGGLAYSIAAQAVANYIQGDLRSPFAERAKLAGYSFTGGKPDDVTVMLAWIKDTSKPDQKISNLSAKL